MKFNQPKENWFPIIALNFHDVEQIQEIVNLQAQVENDLRENVHQKHREEMNSDKSIDRENTKGKVTTAKPSGHADPASESERADGQASNLFTFICN